ncbi:MAG: hypothetical protein JXB10_02780 [Pirellulales bacterium]|nr:hypothetical protein [Pirellulales bacterium]
MADRDVNAEHLVRLKNIAYKSDRIAYNHDYHGGIATNVWIKRSKWPAVFHPVAGYEFGRYGAKPALDEVAKSLF